MEFIDTPPASVSTGKRGRPALFTTDLQEAVKAAGGKWGILQEGVKNRSRLSTLRAAHGEDFLFRPQVTGHQERQNGKGETVTDEILTIWVSAKPVEVPETAPAPKARATKAKAPADAK